MEDRDSRVQEIKLRKRALTVIALASGLLGSSQAAFADEIKTEQTPRWRDTGKRAAQTSDEEAYVSLNVALHYASGRFDPKGEIQFLQSTQWLTERGRWKRGFDAWVLKSVQQLLRDDASGSSTLGQGVHKLSARELALANEAVGAAIVKLGKWTDSQYVLGMTYVAAEVCRKIGDPILAAVCDEKITEAIARCEHTGVYDEKSIEDVVIVLDAMSDRFVHVDIPNAPRHTFSSRDVNHILRGNFRDLLPPLPQAVKCSDEAFFESQKLKLRALALVDRLPSDNHIRRKAHRDLVFWYAALDKNHLSDEQRSILFDLVGSRNDAVLFPQSPGCGNLVWWKNVSRYDQYECGMG